MTSIVSTFDSPSQPLYALAPSPLDSSIACSSFSFDSANTLSLLSPPSSSSSRLGLLASTTVPYPITSIAWDPKNRDGLDVLATTGDALRVYAVRDGRIGEVACLAHTKPIPASSPSHPSTPSASPSSSLLAKNSPAPITNLSWSAFSPASVVTSSIDTTCTVWDVQQNVAVTQLIAHDKEVYDVEWLPNSPAQIFVSVGADGSLRAFDLRSLEHSTILYESPPASSSSGSGGGSGGLVKIAFNPSDSNYLATFSAQSNAVQVLDMRSPGTAVVECVVGKGGGRVNCVSWGRSERGGGLCVGSDDGLLSLFDTTSSSPTSVLPSPTSKAPLSSSSPPAKHGPTAIFDAPGAVDGLAWANEGGWVVCCGGLGGGGNVGSGSGPGWVKGLRVG